MQINTVFEEYIVRLRRRGPSSRFCSTKLDLPVCDRHRKRLPAFIFDCGRSMSVGMKFKEIRFENLLIRFWYPNVVSC